ncbi:MAG: hypothetical protein A3F68_04675 [Acidobacteria bacterium RIFCSPLOWO2_12_FULL_54_10]|nr:MAG: hypothetical protein A3F68_04675 [Acidobacteria bacterium RIFCSPLOWO2_12_FULL_54_10]
MKTITGFLVLSTLILAISTLVFRSRYHAEQDKYARLANAYRQVTANRPSPLTTTPSPSQTTKPATKTQATHADSSGLRRIAGPSWFGCLNRAKFEELNGYLHDQDRAAFIGSVGRAYRDGECVPFEQGEEVYLSDTAIFSGLVQVRRPGKTERWWTYAEAVR